MRTGLRHPADGRGRSSDASGELLRRLLRGVEPGDAPVRGDDLVAALDFHRIGLVLREELLRLPHLPDAAGVHLRRVRMQQATIDLKLRADLRTLARALDAADVAWVVVKGPAVAQDLYGGPGRREYGDLDVLVDGTRLGAALTALEDAGATLLDRNWPFILQHGQAELTLYLPHGTALDLHWHLINAPGVRSAFAVSTRRILARRRTLSVFGNAVPVMDPVDQLLHLALHAALSGGDRLLWLSDVRRAWAQDLDWSEVAGTAADWRVELPLAIMLQRVDRTLGGQVPERRPSGVGGGSTWLRLDRRLLALLPVTCAHRSQESGRSGRSVPMATRPTARASARALLVAQARHHLPKPSADEVRAALHTDAPDREARERYLREAARHAAAEGS